LAHSAWWCSFSCSIERSRDLTESSFSYGRSALRDPSGSLSCPDSAAGRRFRSAGAFLRCRQPLWPPPRRVPWAEGNPVWGLNIRWRPLVSCLVARSLGTQCDSVRWRPARIRCSTAWRVLITVRRRLVCSAVSAGRPCALRWRWILLISGVDLATSSGSLICHPLSLWAGIPPQSGAIIARPKRQSSSLSMRGGQQEKEKKPIAARK